MESEAESIYQLSDKALSSGGILWARKYYWSGRPELLSLTCLHVDFCSVRYQKGREMTYEAVKQQDYSCIFFIRG